MEIRTKITAVPNKDDYYDLKITTYKEKIEGRFERSELRHLMETIDNCITVGIS